jgi:hypothetical protein
MELSSSCFVRDDNDRKVLLKIHLSSVGYPNTQDLNVRSDIDPVTSPAEFPRSEMKPDAELGDLRTAVISVGHYFELDIFFV